MSLAQTIIDFSEAYLSFLWTKKGDDATFLKSIPKEASYNGLIKAGFFGGVNVFDEIVSLVKKERSNFSQPELGAIELLMTRLSAQKTLLKSQEAIDRMRM